MKRDHVFPFLWVRNEKTEKIFREIDAIKETTDAFVIESRPRKGEESDFGTEKWFLRIGDILAYAQKLGMSVWILDDKSFPTGFAGGAILGKYPQLKARQIKANAVDLYSDGSPCLIPTGAYFGEKVIGCFLTRNGKVVRELSAKGDFAVCDGEKGDFRAVTLIETTLSPERAGYIDMLSGVSTEVLVKEIYEEYYSRFKDYFGNTLVGFFSDEPRFCNGYNGFYSPVKSMYDNKPGLLCGAYPYSEEVFSALAQKGYGKADLLTLFGVGDNARLCVDYMNAVTDLYARNFTQKLSAWCKSRGVRYSGHVIEDAGVHFNLGCGAGHYFKAMRGADYAGVDVVLHQIKPFVKRNTVSPIECGLTDYDFNNFTLARLASSCAVQSVTAMGKSVCEVFGAYGWGESVKTMLYLAGHFAVNGINNFIPHAFSMDKNDTDCPPYFYAEGKNPAYGGYKLLFKYMQRLCELSDGRSYARVAVFYDAESVWSGKKYLSIDKIARVLTENGIDFDFIDADNLNAAEKSADGIKIANANYSLLVLGEGYYTPETETLISVLPVPVLRVGKKDLTRLAESVKERTDLPYSFTRNNADLRARLVNANTLMLFNAGAKTIKNRVVFGKDNFVSDPLNQLIVGKGSGNLTEFTIPAGGTLLITPNATGNPLKSGKKIGEIKNPTFEFMRYDKNTFVSSEKYADSDALFSENPDFSGYTRYRFTHNVKKGEYLAVFWRGEYLKAEVGEKTAEFISSPSYIPLAAGKREISLTVCNTLANAEKDYLSFYDKITVCGIDGIKVYKEDKDV